VQILIRLVFSTLIIMILGSSPLFAEIEPSSPPKQPDPSQVIGNMLGAFLGVAKAMKSMSDDDDDLPQRPSRAPRSTPNPQPFANEPPDRFAFRTMDRVNLSRVQGALTKVGYYNSGVDGLFGPGTEFAVRRWQAGKGLATTGYLSPNQLNQLLAEAGSGQREVTPVAAQSATMPVDATTQPKQTEKSKFLREGIAKDIVLIVNTSPKAPNANKNMAGEFEFDKGAAKLCYLPTDDIGDASIKAISDYLTSKRAFNIMSSACSADEMGLFDVLVFERQQFQKLSKSHQDAVIRSVEEGNFERLGVLTAAELKVASDKLANHTNLMSSKIADTKAAGYIGIDLNNESTVLCVLSDEKIDAMVSIASSYLSTSKRMRGLTLEHVSLTPAAAFMAARKGNCGFMYGALDAFRSMWGPLQKEKLKITFFPNISSQVDIDRRDEEFRKGREDEQFRIAEQQRKLEADQRLAAERAAAEAAKRAQSLEEQREKLDSLRNANRARAQALADGMGKSAAALLTGKGQEFSVIAPIIAQWWGARQTEKWEYVSSVAEIYDYGKATWKGRILEGFATRIKVKIKHRSLGEYRESCYVVAYLDDTEFGMSRELLALSCDDAAGAFPNWKAANKFASQWNLD
jgi:Putative peptidoglycan binding domain